MKYLITFMATGGLTVEAESEEEARRIFEAANIQEQASHELAMNGIDITDVSVDLATSLTNAELNTALYEKMFEEQEKFRGWLLSQSPEEILNHTYQYTIQEDILLSLENESLTDEQAQALLDSSTPLADIYNAFGNIDTDHMEYIWECVESQADALIDLRLESDRSPCIFEALKQELFRVGHHAIEDFCGCAIDPWADKDTLDRMLDMAYEQMPDDVLSSFCNKYLPTEVNA